MELGGVLSALDALGSAERSNWTGPPQPGNDFHTRYGEDLRLLAELGVTRLRLGFDWARLQPHPGGFDDDWREWYQHVLRAATEAGVQIWATLHEHTVPAWFDDEGSFGDAKAAGRWWPRWVEHCAETFGDEVAGWYPIDDPVSACARWSGDPKRHEEALVDLAVAWRDAHRILRGGPPVASSLAVHLRTAPADDVPARQAVRREDHLRWALWFGALRDGRVRLPGGTTRTIAALAGSVDVLGVSATLDLPEGQVDDRSLPRWQERLGSIVRRAGEEGPERPLVISGIRVTWSQPEERRLLVERAVGAARQADADGVRLVAVHVDPVIGSERDREAATVVDRDRNVSETSAAWAALSR